MNKTIHRLLIISIFGTAGLYANWVPGKVNYILQTDSLVKVSLKRTDNGTTIWRFIPANKEKNMLAILLTAMSGNKSVSCDVSGAYFKKCFVYANTPTN